MNWRHALAQLLGLARWSIDQQEPADETLWHRWTPAGPVWLIDGTWWIGAGGQVWRRRVGDQFVYRQDVETDDEFAGRAW